MHNPLCGLRRFFPGGYSPPRGMLVASLGKHLLIHARIWWMPQKLQKSAQ
jgi:hypothetical protein